MRLKPINPEKELKKVQKKGIYNPKLKIVGIAGVIIGIALIYTTYAFFNYNSTKAISFNSQVDKKVNIEIEVKNGTTNNSKITTKYNQELRVKVNPNEGYTYESVVCTNSQTGTYDEINNELIIKPTIYTKCTITFTETLRHIILASNVLKTQTPDFTKAEPDPNGSYNNSGLYKAEDEYGDSYYFRGAVENNYVKFANKIWRIVRINGDKSIRLILNDRITPVSQYNSEDLQTSVGYTYNNGKICTRENPCNAQTGVSSIVKQRLEKWYSENLSKYDNYIALGSFCNDTTYTGNYEYNPRNRLNNQTNATPSLKCNDTTLTYGGFYKLKIGLITSDEVSMAGFRYNSYGDSVNNYLSKNFSYWTMSPGAREELLAVDYNYIYYYMPNEDNSIVPVINLNTNVTITKGNGTVNNPYVIK